MGAPDPFDMQATRLPLANDARRYTQSTMSYISIEGLAVAIGELLTLGSEKIKAHAGSLAALLLEELEGSGWTSFRPLGTRSASAHIIALEHPRGSVERAVESLREANIICGSRNDRIRISLAHFNDENDIRSLAQALRHGLPL